MAYAAVAGLPAVVGLWAVVASLPVYALLGSSRQLSVGPESTTALMTAAAVGPLAAGDPARYAALAATLALLVGGLCLLASFGRLGFLADLLSRPVLVGYLAGIAMIMIVSQLGTRWAPSPECCCSGCCTACCSRSGCPSWTCCAGSRGRTTASSGTSRAWPAC